MPVYRYNAIDGDSRAENGTLVADTPRGARDLLRDRGLEITDLAPVIDEEATPFRRPFGRLRGRAAVADFIRELATLLGAGIPLSEALKTLSRQHGGRLGVVIDDIRERVTAGASLAAALRRHGDWFDELSVSIVTVGENTGSLDEALRRLAAFKEKAMNLRNRVVTALMYPLVILAVGVAVTLFLMTYVVPNLIDAVRELGRDLPWVTTVVKSVSDFLVDWWWALAGGIAVAGGFLAAALRTDRGRLICDAGILRIPLIGDLVRKENTSRIAVVLASLLSSGLRFVEAVRITRGIVRNAVFTQALEDYEKAVASGRDIAGALEGSRCFTPMVVQMLAVGQQTGEIEEMLLQLARSYDRQVETATRRLTAVLEPLLIVILAVLIGFVAFATILPILEAGNVM